MSKAWLRKYLRHLFRKARLGYRLGGRAPAARQARGPSAAARQARGPSAAARQARGPSAGAKQGVHGVRWVRI